MLFQIITSTGLPAVYHFTATSHGIGFPLFCVKLYQCGRGNGTLQGKRGGWNKLDLLLMTFYPRSELNLIAFPSLHPYPIPFILLPSTLCRQWWSATTPHQLFLPPKDYGGGGAITGSTADWIYLAREVTHGAVNRPRVITHRHVGLVYSSTEGSVRGKTRIYSIFGFRFCRIRNVSRCNYGAYC